MSPSRAELLVVDGYNVIRSSDRYRHMVDEPRVHARGDIYAPARHALLADVAEFAHGSYDPVVVFDGFGNPDPQRADLRFAGVRVMFSPYGVEADAVIERLVRDARAQGRTVTVVTSDAVVQATVAGEGVTRLSARMFTDESDVLDAHLAQMSESPRPAVHTHSTVASRIAPDVAARLHEMTLPKNAPSIREDRR